MTIDANQIEAVFRTAAQRASSLDRKNKTSHSFEGSMAAYAETLNRSSVPVWAEKEGEMTAVEELDFLIQQITEAIGNL